MEHWRKLIRLDVRLSVSGALFRIKGHPEGLHDVIMHIDPQRSAVTICPFGRPDCRGHFTPDRVWIEDREHHTIEERANPRGSFAGHVLNRRWDKMHMLYFIGYALWNDFRVSVRTTVIPCV